jgi:hypothetical protein
MEGAVLHHQRLVGQYIFNGDGTRDGATFHVWHVANARFAEVDAEDTRVHTGATAGQSIRPDQPVRPMPTFSVRFRASQSLSVALANRPSARHPSEGLALPTFLACLESAS